MNCDASYVIVDDKFINSSQFTNDSKNPFEYKDGVIKSTNITANSTSSFKIKVVESTYVEIKAYLYLQSTDKFTIKINGVVQTTRQNVKTNMSFAYNLNANDTLEIVYTRGSSSKETVNSYVSVTNIKFYYEE